jgi:uncharacterized membrane protein
MKQLSIFYKRVYEASIPCAILMVQGNVLGLTPKHILIALKTGILTGAFAVILSFVPYLKQLYNNKVVLAFVIFACTTSADLLNHPSHFFGEYGEALATGLCAVLIFLGVQYASRSKS